MSLQIHGFAHGFHVSVRGKFEIHGSRMNSTCCCGHCSACVCDSSCLQEAMVGPRNTAHGVSAAVRSRHQAVACEIHHVCKRPWLVRGTARGVSAAVRSRTRQLLHDLTSGIPQRILRCVAAHSCRGGFCSVACVVSLEDNWVSYRGRNVAFPSKIRVNQHV